MTNKAKSSSDSSEKMDKPDHQVSSSADDKPVSTNHSSQMLILILSMLSFVLSIALAGVVYWMWQNNQNQTRVQTKIEIELDQNQQKLRNQLNEFKKMMEDNSEGQTKLSERMSRISQLVHSREVDDNEWLMAEVGYLLQLAEYQMVFSNDRSSVITLLETVDKRLEQVNTSDAVELRRQVKRYLAALKSTPPRDIAGLLSQLEALEKELPSLKLLTPIAQTNARSSSEASHQHAEKTSWKQKISEAFSQLGGLVVIRRHDEKISPLITPEQKQHLMQQMQVQFIKAQWAVLRHDDEVYQQSLENIEKWLKKYFDIEHATGKYFLETIESLKKRKLKPEWPSFDGMIKAISIWQKAKTTAVE